MEIFINHAPVQTTDFATLAQVLAEQGLDKPGIAVAIENRVVPREQWADTPLSAGTDITVIRAVCGG